MKEQATPVCDRAIPGIQRIRLCEPVLAFVRAEFDIKLADGLNRRIRALPALAEVNELVVRYGTLNQLVEGLAQSRPLFWIDHMNDRGCAPDMIVGMKSSGR
ncbi:MAG TPA: hypothetical protein PK640_09160 [Verrucomicrobiota bacterium]|nr:hypothetical protein [Verrucomicrobiota bacterium]